MTDTLHDELVGLAAAAAIPTLDLHAVVHAASRRRFRSHAAAAAVALSLLGAGSVAALAWRADTQSLKPADDGITNRDVTPSAKALQVALDAVVPGSRLTRVREFPSEYLPPGSSAFAERIRFGRVDATVEFRDGTGISVQWDALDDPLDDEEARRFVGYQLEHDDTAPRPVQRLLKQEDGTLSGLRLWRIEETDRTGTTQAFLRLAAWESNGVNLVLSRSAPFPAAPDEPQAAATLLALAEILTESSRSDQDRSYGRAGPFIVTQVPDGIELRRTSTFPAAEIAGAPATVLYAQRWEGIDATDGRQVTINVGTLGGARAKSLLARTMNAPNNPRRIAVRNGTGVIAGGGDRFVLSFVDGPDYVQIVGADGVTEQDLLAIAQALTRPATGPLSQPLAAFAKGATALIEPARIAGCITPELAQVLASRDYTRDTGPDGKTFDNEVVVRVATQGRDEDLGQVVRVTVLFDGTTGKQITTFTQSWPYAQRPDALTSLRQDEIPCPPAASSDAG